MIFPESELSTYLGFFVPSGQVEPLLDRIAEASSDFEELDLVGFLHLAQRELELTGDVNRDDAAVVLIEELQLPLADAASVLEENPAATAARLQSAWADIPDQHTGPLPDLLRDGLIMLDPGLELDESLELDPSLAVINPQPADEPEPAPFLAVDAGGDAVEAEAVEAIEAVEAENLEDEHLEDGPPVEVEVFPAPEVEPELVVAAEPEFEESVAEAAGEPEMVPGPAMLAEIAEDGDDAEDGEDESAIVHNPYAALTPESLEGSSQSFPWNPHDHGQPVTAAELLDLDDDPVLIQRPSEPITHVTGRIPVAEILDGETDAIAAFPSQHVASDVPLPTSSDSDADALAGLLLDAAARGDTLLFEGEQGVEDDQGVEDGQRVEEEPIFEDEPAFDDEPVFEEEPDFDDEPDPELAADEADAAGDEPETLVDAFGEADSPEEPAEHFPGPGSRKVTTPYWMRKQPPAQPPQDLPAPGWEPVGDMAASHLDEPTSQWSFEDMAEFIGGDPANQPPAGTGAATWGAPMSDAPMSDAPMSDAPFPTMPPPGSPPQHAQRCALGGDDTQQIPEMAMLAELAADPQPPVGANLVGDHAVSPSVERFLDDLHGSWIAGGQDVLQRPVSDVPLGGRLEIAEPPVNMPPPARPKPPAAGAALTNDEAVEATYEEELVPEPPAAPVPPAPTAVWIPGMADRAFRSTPWHQIEDDDQADTGGSPNLHGFGASVPPPRPPVRQSPAEMIQDADIAAFMGGGPADAPEWDGPEEGVWAHADYGPKRPKANRVGQVSGILAVALAAGVGYLYASWPPFAAAINALGLPISPIVVVAAIAGVLGIGGLSMFIGSSIPKKPKVKVVRRRRRKADVNSRLAEDLGLDELNPDDPDAAAYLEDSEAAYISDADSAAEEPGEELTDVWEEDRTSEN